MSTEAKVISFSDAKASGQTENFVTLFAQAPRTVRTPNFQKFLPSEEYWKMFLVAPYRSEFWILKINDQVVGRIGAGVSTSDSQIGCLGFFEIAEAQANLAITHLITPALQWFKKNSIQKVLGPLNLSTWFNYRFGLMETVGKEGGFAWEPNQPAFYLDLWKQAGFSLLEKYHSRALEITQYRDAHKKAYEKVLQAGYTFRPISFKPLVETELKILHQLTMKSFAENFLFEPLSFELFKMLYVPALAPYDFTLSRFILSPEGVEQGYMLAFKDRETTVFKTLVIAPEARGKSLANALNYECADAAIKMGLKTIIAALIRAGHATEAHTLKSALLWQHEYELLSLLLV